MDIVFSIYYLAAPFCSSILKRIRFSSLSARSLYGSHEYGSSHGRFSDGLPAPLIIGCATDLSPQRAFHDPSEEIWVILALSWSTVFCLSIYWPPCRHGLQIVRDRTGCQGSRLLHMSWTAATLAGPILSGALYSLGRDFLLVAAESPLCFFFSFSQRLHERGVSSTEKVERQDRETSHWLRRFLFAAWVANFASWFILGNARYQFQSSPGS